MVIFFRSMPTASTARILAEVRAGCRKLGHILPYIPDYTAAVQTVQTLQILRHKKGCELDMPVTKYRYFGCKTNIKRWCITCPQGVCPKILVSFALLYKFVL